MFIDVVTYPQGEEYYKLTGKNLNQWSALIASSRIRWELVSDMCIGCNDSKSWSAVKEARLMAHKNA